MKLRELFPEILLIGSILINGGCDLMRTPVPPTLDPGMVITHAAQTIIARMTIEATLATWTPTPTSTSTPTPTPTPTETPTPTDTPTPTETPFLTDTPTPTPTIPLSVSFRDDFSIDTGWFTVDRGDYGFRLVQGGYLVFVNVLNTPIWSVRQRKFIDVSLEVDASVLSGAEDNYYGLVCRQVNGDNYYALVISPNGSYGIAKAKEGVFSFIQEGEAPSGVIKSGMEVNRVRADCMGKTLSLYANQVKLVEVEDSDFEGGWVGVIVGTRFSSGVEVLFDNFAAMKP